MKKLGVNTEQDDWALKIKDRDDLYICTYCFGEVDAYNSNINEKITQQEKKRIEEEKRIKEEQEALERKEFLRKSGEELAFKLFDKEPRMKEFYLWLQNHIGKKIQCKCYDFPGKNYTLKYQGPPEFYEVIVEDPTWYHWNKEEGIAWPLNVVTGGYLYLNKISMPCEEIGTIRKFSFKDKTLEYSEGQYDTGDYATLASKIQEVTYYRMIELTPIAV